MRLPLLFVPLCDGEIPSRKTAGESLGDESPLHRSESAVVDFEEVKFVVSLWKTLVESLTKRPLFPGVQSLVCAALDLSAALEGLALEHDKTLSLSAPTQKSDIKTSEETAWLDERPFVKAFTQRLARLSREDRKSVVAHFPLWLRLLPPPSRTSQPFEDILKLVQKVTAAGSSCAL